MSSPLRCSTRRPTRFSRRRFLSTAPDIDLIAGSFSGATPGFFFLGLPVPLNLDAYSHYTLGQPNLPPLSNSFGRLDRNGMATAQFTPFNDPILVGLTLDHAGLIFESAPFRWKGSTNAESVFLRR